MIEDLTNKIEALLFSAAKIMAIEEIEEVIGINDKESIKNSIEELQERHKETSLIVLEEKNGYRFTIKEKYMGIVSKVVEDTEINKSVMETLAVIAWKAPVLQSEVIGIRSNKAYDHISELKESGFIVKEKFGRSYKIKLAPKFYEYFDIRNKEDIKNKFEEVEKKAEESQVKKIEDIAKKQDKKEKSVEESLEEIRANVKKSREEQEKLLIKQKKEMEEEKEIIEALEADETKVEEEKTEKSLDEGKDKFEDDIQSKEDDQTIAEPEAQDKIEQDNISDSKAAKDETSPEEKQSEDIKNKEDIEKVSEEDKKDN